MACPGYQTAGRGVCLAGALWWPAGRAGGRRLRPALIVALLVLACSSDLGLSGREQVACSAGGGCPAGLTCRAAVDLCVPVASGDRRAPGLVSSSVTPAVAGAGQSIMVELEADEPLAFPPRVTLQLSEPRSLEQVSEDGSRFAFAYAPAGDEPRQTPLPVTALLVDRQGNAAPDLALGTVTFDLRAPILSPVEVVGPSRVARGVTARVRFTADEPLAAGLRVTLDPGGRELEPSDATEPPTYVFAYTPGDADDPGVYGVVVSARDAAGNAAEEVTPEVLGFDFEAPGYAEEPALLDTVVRPGALVVATLAADEPLGGTPTLHLARGSARAELRLALHDDGPQPRLVYTREATPEDAGGEPWDLLVEGGADLAGNALPGRMVPAALGIDADPPGLDGPAVPDKPGGVYRAGETVRITFAVDEPLAFPPRATLQTSPERPLTCAVEGQGWSCALDRPLDGSERPQGPVGVSLELSDLAGNSAPERALVVLDFQPPDLAQRPARVARCDGRPEARVAEDEVWVGPALDCDDGGPSVRVAFLLDEWTDAARPPVVELPALGAALVLVTGEPGGRSFSFGYDPRGDEPEADPADPAAAGLEVRASVRDPAGNEAALVLGRLRFDATPPSPRAGEDGPAGFVHVRDPWGSAPAYLPGTRVVLAAGALAEPAVVTAWSEPAAAALLPDPLLAASDEPALGRGRYEPDTGASVDLGGGDVAIVSVTLADLAGNTWPAAARLRLDRVEWRATLGGKVAGDTQANPHELYEGATPAGQPVRRDLDLRPVSDPSAYAAVARLDGTPAVVTSQLAPWRRLAGVREAPAVVLASTWFDTRRGKLVLFGGRTSDEVVSDATWEWDGRWQRRAPVTVPRSAFAGQAAWDSHRLRGVLEGGGAYRDSYPYADTWEWDGLDWAQRDLVRGGPKAYAALAYDAARRETVVLGGFNDAHVPDDHWNDTVLFDGHTWTRVLPDPDPSPAWRGRYALAYHAVSERVVLFGGQDVHGPLFGDTWEWDGTAWEERHPPISPPARQEASMAYDPVRETLVLAGGCGAGACGRPGSNVLTDLWEWDGDHWKQRRPPTPLPLQRPQLAYDPGRDVVLAFGNEGNDDHVLPAVWAWDRQDWHRLDPVDEPPARAGAPLVLDAARGRVERERG